jgi:hypothetical protein
MSDILKEVGEVEPFARWCTEQAGYNDSTGVALVPAKDGNTVWMLNNLDEFIGAFKTLHPTRQRELIDEYLAATGQEWDDDREEIARMLRDLIGHFGPDGDRLVLLKTDYTRLQARSDMLTKVMNIITEHRENYSSLFLTRAEKQTLAEARRLEENSDDNS